MGDLALLLFVGYIGYLALRGVTGGEGALQSHLMLLWALIILGNLIGLAYLVVKML